MEYDFFLSYASEDITYVEKLRGALRKQGKDVWFDKEQIRVGDDIRRVIERGMTLSRNGVVILSPSFFDYWPEAKLSVLFALENQRGTRILPVLLNVEPEDIVRLSPFLASREAISAEEELDVVAEALCAAIDPSKPPPRLGKKRRVFLSYASPDRDKALALRSLFETLGFDDIVDRSTLRGGFKREAKLNEAIDEAGSMFVLWSEHASGNEDIKREYSQYLKKNPNSPCTPLPLDGTPMPPELAERQQPNFLVLSNNLVAYRNDLQTKGVSDTEITRLVRERLKKEGVEAGVDPKMIKYLLSASIAGTLATTFAVQSGVGATFLQGIASLLLFFRNAILQLALILFAAVSVGLAIEYFGAKPPPDMAYIPAGAFMMGCVPEDSACEDDEKPRHEVFLYAYYIDKTEVTVAAYRKCVEAGMCEEPRQNEYSNYHTEGREKHPVNNVSWHQANTYCAFVGKRLPTEAQWEKAARAQDGDIYPWGNTEPSDRHTQFGKGLSVPILTTPVGSHPPAAHGLYDMAGNLWEWVEDCYDKDAYKRRQNKTITNPRNNKGVCPSGGRVLRGGSFNLGPGELAGVDSERGRARALGQALRVPLLACQHVRILKILNFFLILGIYVY